MTFSKPLLERILTLLREKTLWKSVDEFNLDFELWEKVTEELKKQERREMDEKAKTLHSKTNRG